MENRQLHVLAEGKYMRLVAADGWEWVERVNTSGAVVIATITTEDQIVLVEQYRVPLRARVIELPAGLVGDTPATEGEAMLVAAKRELLEETGYESDHWRRVLVGPSSPGLTTEDYTLFVAQHARRVASGGGDASEDIEVHVVARGDADVWLAQRREEGTVIDPRIYIGLYFAERQRPA